MQYFLLKETLEPCAAENLSAAGEGKYVALLTSAEWQRESERFDMGIELDPTTREIHSTKAEVNFDSLTGTFRLPDRDALTERDYRFAFALDEKGIVFIDESGVVGRILQTIAQTRRWREPSLERFLYDFLEQIVSRDLPIMERYEKELDDIEDEILSDKGENRLVRVSQILDDVRELRVHYEQLIDMTQELEENENGFFSENKLRYLHLFMNPYGPAARRGGLSAGAHGAGAGPLPRPAGGKAKPHHDAPHRRDDDLHATDAAGGVVRHELPVHAGAG